VHGWNRSVDWPVVVWLGAGSLPASALTLVLMRLHVAARIQGGFLLDALALVLLVTALGLFLKRPPPARAAAPEPFRPWRIPLTVLAGALLGAMVTLTSIGAGALGTVLLVALHPRRLDASRLVGTDLAHAIPLALVAGLGHLGFGHVDPRLMMNLLLGSVPGVLIGSLLSTRAPQLLLRRGIALTLGALAVRILAG
jgi:hypothetical protein